MGASRRSETANAPMKAVDQDGVSPFRADVTSHKTESNCVLLSGGREQLEMDDQSVTFGAPETIEWQDSATPDWGACWQCANSLDRLAVRPGRG